MSLYTTEQEKAIAEVHGIAKSFHEKMLPLVTRQEEELKKFGAVLGQTADKIANLEEEYKSNNEKAYKEIRQEHSELKQALDSLVAERQQLVGMDGHTELRKSFGMTFASMQDLKNMIRTKKGAEIDDLPAIKKAFESGVSPREQKWTNGLSGASLTDIRDVQTTTRLDEIFAEPLRMERVRDYIPVIPVTGSAVQYWQRTDFADDGTRENAWENNNAAMVLEAGTKPYSKFEGESVIEPVRVLAHIFVISEQLLDDAPAFARHVDVYGRGGLDEREDSQILKGGGTGADLEGLMIRTGIRTFTQSTDSEVGDTEIDVIARASALVRKNSHRPDALMTGIGAATSIKLAKGSDGQYIWGAQALSGGRPTIWGVPLVETSALEDDEGIIGSFRMCVGLLDRMKTTLRVSDSHAEIFEQNMLALRYEKRIGLMVVRLSGLRKIAFDGRRQS